MRIFKDFDEIKATVETEVGVSGWIDVTQRRSDPFARATGADPWIHVGVARAERDPPTGTTIAHGLITLGLASVPAGSRLRSRVAVAAADDMRRTGLRVTYGVTTEIENRAPGLCGRAHCRALPMNEVARARRRFECDRGRIQSLWRLS